MASIEITLRDDQGNIINEEKRRIYDLNLGNKRFSEVRFNDIEKAVVEFRRIALPDVTSDLLKEAQADYKKEIKKEELKCNGTSPVNIKSLNGMFPFRVQRFLMDFKETKQQASLMEAEKYEQTDAKGFE